MSNKRKTMLGVLAATMILNSSFVFADKKLDSLKEKKKTTLTEMQDKKKEIDSLESETRSIESEIRALDKRVDEAKTAMKEAEDNISIIEKDIKKTEEELEKAEEKLEKKEEVFGARLRVMYRNKDAGFLEVLLSSSDLKDFISKKRMVQAIAEQDIELMEEMKTQRDEINKQKLGLQSQRASLEATKARLNKKKEELESATRSKSILVSGLKDKLNAAEKDYDKLNKLAKEVENEILERQSGGAVYSGGRMGWPIPGHTRISSPFGYRTHPVFKTKKLHTGIDIPAGTGTNVVAAAGGKVIYSGNLGGYGKTIMVDHGGGIVTLYAHNSSLVASQGQSVAKGAVIAKVGSTGVSTGPHSHFEVRKNGAYVNPIPWLRG